MSEPVRNTLPPVRRSITVDWPQDTAFQRFTAQIASWWPLRSHSIGQERADTVFFEGRVGGRIYERMRDGEECTWGTVTAWEPPERVAFTWHPGQAPAIAQDIEVRFVAVSAGTRLELTHTGWERLGALGSKTRRAYSLGWVYVLKLWAGRSSSPVVWGIDALMWTLRPLQRRMARRAKALEAVATADRHPS